MGLIVMCTLSTASNVMADYTGQPTVVIDGTTITTTVPPYILDGTTMVPLRSISEYMGADVEWDAANRTIHIEKGTRTIDLTVGKVAAKINGETVTTSMSPVIKNNYTMVPLRFIGEALDCDVSWEAETKTVIIKSSDETVVTPEVPTQQTDAYGRAIRTTNLPSNANKFPYIAEGVPNWCYEQQEKIWTNNYWTPLYTLTETPNGEVSSNCKMNYMYEDDDIYDEVGALSPRGLLAGNSSLFPQNMSGGIYEMADKFIDAQLNVDYNTIDSADFVNTMVSSIDASTYVNSGWASVKDYSEAYVAYAKENKIVTSCDYNILPETMWVDLNNEVHFSVYVKFTANSAESTDDFLFGNSRAAILKSDSYDLMKLGQTYEGVVTYSLKKDASGNWKFDFMNTDVEKQLNPSIDLTDAVPPSQTRSDRIQKFGYPWTTKTQQLIVYDRYSVPSYDESEAIPATDFY
jgi:hypothetical protein